MFDDLLERERAVLAKLQLLSDAPAQVALDEKMSLARVHPSGSPPPGVRFSGKDGPPSKDVSLYAYHWWHIENARRKNNRLARATVVAYAELDWEQAVYRKPRHEIKRETGAEIRSRVAREYPGEHPVKVAAREGISESAVRKWRRSFGLDSLTGLVPGS